MEERLRRYDQDPRDYKHRAFAGGPAKENKEQRLQEILKKYEKPYGKIAQNRTNSTQAERVPSKMSYLRTEGAESRSPLGETHHNSSLYLQHRDTLLSKKYERFTSQWQEPPQQSFIEETFAQSKAVRESGVYG